MMKMEIHLDEKKVIDTDEYDLNEIYEAIDEVFELCKLIKGENGFYYGKNDDYDFRRFGSVIVTLSDDEWFMKYVDKWLWYNSDESDDPKNFEVEDLIETFEDEIKEMCYAKKYSMD